MRYGDGLYRLRYDEISKESVIEGQSPELWFPVVSPNNIRNVQYHVLAWTYEKADPIMLPMTDIPLSDRMKKYLRVEIHAKGTVEHRLYELTQSGGIRGQVSDPRAVEVDFPKAP